MPEVKKVEQVDPHCVTEIRAASKVEGPQARSDVYDVLGDQKSHVQVQADSRFSLAAACGLVLD